MDQAFGEFRPPSDVTVFDIDAGGVLVLCQWITAPDVPQNKRIIYFHGEAFATCSPTTN